MSHGFSTRSPQVEEMARLKGFWEMYLLLWNKIRRIKNQVCGSKIGKD